MMGRDGAISFAHCTRHRPNQTISITPKTKCSNADGVLASKVVRMLAELLSIRSLHHPARSNFLRIGMGSTTATVASQSQ